MHIVELRNQVKTDIKKIADLQSELSEAEVALEKVKRLEKEANERITKLQKTLNEETSLRISLENSSRDIDARHRRAIQEIREEKEAEVKQRDLQVGALKSEVAALKNQLRDLNVKTTENKSDFTKSSEDVKTGVWQNGALQTRTLSLAAGELAGWLPV
jgi:chromosome segregation ATPase